MGVILADETKIKVIKQPRYFYLNQAQSEKKNNMQKAKKVSQNVLGILSEILIIDGQEIFNCSQSFSW